MRRPCPLASAGLPSLDVVLVDLEDGKRLRQIRERRVLLNQLARLSGQLAVGLPTPALPAAVGNVDSAQPVVLVPVWIQTRVRRHGLPQPFKAFEVLFEVLCGFRIAQAAQRGQQAFASVVDRDVLEELHAARDFARDYRPQRLPVDQRLFADVLVEVERLLQVGEDAEVVHHYARALLHRWQWPIRPGDGLEQVVVAQRLVEVHHLLDWRVETS